MNRSRAIAAGTSVGALVALTAGVAVANPGAHSSPPAARASNATRVQNPTGGNDARDDTGWLAPDDGTDPNPGWSTPRPDSGSGTFDPGVGGDGSTRSGGS